MKYTAQDESRGANIDSHQELCTFIQSGSVLSVLLHFTHLLNKQTSFFEKCVNSSITNNYPTTVL